MKHIEAFDIHKRDVIGHEIRTKLGAILGFIELLRDNPTSLDEKKHYLEILDRNSKQLSVLLDQVLANTNRSEQPQPAHFPSL